VTKRGIFTSKNHLLIEEKIRITMTSLKVLMVGCGKMGGALLGNWMRGGDEFTIVDPVLESVPDGAALVRNADELSGPRYDVLIIAIKPQLVDKVMPAYTAMLAPGGYALSIAAGCSIARIKSVLNGAPVIRVMPNLPAAIGQGVSALCASADATPDHSGHARALMEHAGTAIMVEDEDQIDRFTGIAGSGPGYIFEFARAYVEAAMSMGFDEAAARAMVLDTMAGTIAMARSSDEDLESLRNSVTSKGGTTAAGLDAFNGEREISALMAKTVAAAYNRALELK
jgi:pyrroline-5-carboxylate reductase